MLIGARTAAWGGGGAIDPLHGYGGDPLIAYWDGIDITQSTSGSNWIDLVSGIAANGNVTLDGTQASWPVGVRLDIGDNQDIRTAINSHHFSLEFVNSPYQSYIFSFGYDGNGLWIRNRNFEGRLGNSSVSSMFMSISDETSDKCHTAIVFDGNNIYGYRNGTRDKSNIGVVGDAAQLGNVGGYIAGTSSFTSQVAGNMTAFRIRPFSMTNAQVAKYYALDKARFNLP